MLTLMHERRELGPVLVALVGDDREAFKYRLKSLANRARLITQLAEVLEVIGDMAIMPGDQDRLDTGEVLVERGASNAGFLGNLGHRHSPQPVPRDQGRGRIEDRLVDLSAVRLNRVVPELRDHARIWVGAHGHSVFYVDTMSRCTLHCGNGAPKQLLCQLHWRKIWRTPPRPRTPLARLMPRRLAYRAAAIRVHRA